MSFTSVKNSLGEQIKRRAFELGFDLAAIHPLKIPPQHQAAYSTWCDDGFAAGMTYMLEGREKRLDPQLAYPEFNSVLTLGVSYFQGPRPPKPDAGFGRIARYAWGLDYHEIILDRLQSLLLKLNDILGLGQKAILAVDTKPLLERALAQSAGLGFIGKNTVLIAPHTGTDSKSRLGFHVGSWVFLAEILMNIPLEEADDSVPVANGCGGCTACLVACPTNAFEGPYRLKSERCISYLTIENKGWIPIEIRSAIGDWVFGCDVCQDVCPFNARAFETRWPEFKANEGVGPWISLSEILGVKDTKTFKEKYGRTPLLRPKRRGLVRNACVAAGNSQDEKLVPLLEDLLDDPEPIVRGHAIWALARLAPNLARRSAEGKLNSDLDAQVRKECELILAA